MKVVESLNDLKANIKTLDKYLNSKIDPEYSFGLSLVKRGTCFIAVNENGSYKFYPSRFIGYMNNSGDAHLNNQYKDGRETNSAIFLILESKPVPNKVLEKRYKEYYQLLGFAANDKGSFGVERKYWEI